MAQNSQRLAWAREEVDKKLNWIMATIHKSCFETAKDFGDENNLLMGANIAGFLKVADAMLDQGLV